jgi:hypothetical protein
MIKLIRYLGFIAGFLGLIAGVGSLISVPLAGAQSNSRVSPCHVSQIRESLSTNAKTYAPGTSVKMTVSIRNLSPKTCSVAIGPTSPSVSIINAQGAVVWNNCYAGDQPGACAMFLMLHTLKPKGLYSFSKSWNQRGGSTSTFAARGTYELTSHFSGLGPNKISFTLIP